MICILTSTLYPAVTCSVMCRLRSTGNLDFTRRLLPFLRAARASLRGLASVVSGWPTVVPVIHEVFGLIRWEVELPYSAFVSLGTPLNTHGVPFSCTVTHAVRQAMEALSVVDCFSSYGPCICAAGEEQTHNISSVCLHTESVGLVTCGFGPAGQFTSLGSGTPDNRESYPPATSRSGAPVCTNCLSSMFNDYIIS